MMCDIPLILIFRLHKSVALQYGISCNFCNINLVTASVTISGHSGSGMINKPELIQGQDQTTMSLISRKSDMRQGCQPQPPDQIGRLG